MGTLPHPPQAWRVGDRLIATGAASCQIPVTVNRIVNERPGTERRARGSPVMSLEQELAYRSLRGQVFAGACSNQACVVVKLHFLQVHDRPRDHKRSPTRLSPPPRSTGSSGAGRLRGRQSSPMIRLPWASCATCSKSHGPTRQDPTTRGDRKAVIDIHNSEPGKIEIAGAIAANTRRPAGRRNVLQPTSIIPRRAIPVAAPLFEEVFAARYRARDPPAPGRTPRLLGGNAYGRRYASHCRCACTTAAH
jgi:hypothetical protein